MKGGQKTWIEISSEEDLTLNCSAKCVRFTSSLSPSSSITIQQSCVSLSSELNHSIHWPDCTHKPSQPVMASAEVSEKSMSQEFREAPTCPQISVACWKDGLNRHACPSLLMLKFYSVSVSPPRDWNELACMHTPPDRTWRMLLWSRRFLGEVCLCSGWYTCICQEHTGKHDDGISVDYTVEASQVVSDKDSVCQCKRRWYNPCVGKVS